LSDRGHHIRSGFGYRKAVVTSYATFRHIPSMRRKDMMIDAIRQLPDDADFSNAIEEIRIIQRIEDSERAADEGRVRAQEDVRGLIRSWTTG